MLYKLNRIILKILQKTVVSNIFFVIIVFIREEFNMPEISLFYGIRVTMYYEDHNPPHFHAEYNGNKALIDIAEARVIKGSLPSRQLKLILAWCVIHQDELMQNWELSKDGLPLNRINPLI